MTDPLAHRGPDAPGHWIDLEGGSGSCPRRVSGIDLSPTGAQPMFSASGRFVVTYNGEIYNYQDLRAELLDLGHSFRGPSDTEVLLAAIEQWGIADAPKRLFGIFAFAIWDRAERMLHLV